MGFLKPGDNLLTELRLQTGDNDIADPHHLLGLGDRRYRSACFDNVAAVVGVWDPEGVIATANPLQTSFLLGVEDHVPNLRVHFIRHNQVSVHLPCFAGPKQGFRVEHIHAI